MSYPHLSLAFAGYITSLIAALFLHAKFAREREGWNPMTKTLPGQQRQIRHSLSRGGSSHAVPAVAMAMNGYAHIWARRIVARLITFARRTSLPVPPNDQPHLENGRLFHGFRKGIYMYPCDEVHLQPHPQ